MHLIALHRYGQISNQFLSAFLKIKKQTKSVKFQRKINYTKKIVWYEKLYKFKSNFEPKWLSYQK